MKLYGIDVSTFQRNVDWQVVKSQIDFAMLRAGYGKNNIDEKFVKNASECNSYNIPIGLYWFSYAYNIDMAKKEAEYVIKQAKKYDIKYPIAYDLEYESAAYIEKHGIPFTKSLVMDMTIAFCDEVKKAGYIPMVYMNKDFRNRFFDISLLKEKGYHIWYAYYETKYGDPENVEMWQYDSKKLINGITDKVDANICFINYNKTLQEGWVEEEPGKYKYYLPGGEDFIRNDWILLNNKWYRFDAAGWMVTGWFQDCITRKYYYMKENGSMASNEILKIKSDKFGMEIYAFAEDGHMLMQCRNDLDRGNLL